MTNKRAVANKRLKKAKDESDFPHNFICSPCAIKNKFKWPKGHCATVHTDNCPYCGKKGQLAAVTDWLRPGQKKLNYLIWD